MQMAQLSIATQFISNRLMASSHKNSLTVMAQCLA